MTNNNTAVYRSFVREPMTDKSVRALPGIGDATAERLIAEGYTLAFDVYLEFLKCDQDQEDFENWFNTTCGPRTRHQDCFRALEEWHGQFGARTMADLDVDVLGKDLARKLREKGFTKAIHVFGKFLRLDKNEEQFKRWLVYVCEADEIQQNRWVKYLKQCDDQLFKKPAV